MTADGLAGGHWDTYYVRLYKSFGLIPEDVTHVQR
jgi:hypothetical protein